jgi:hypothetical protein
MNNILKKYVSTIEFVARDLEKAKFSIPHADIAQLPAPFFLIDGDLSIGNLEFETGTVVIKGNLNLTHDLVMRHSGKPRANLIVLGDCNAQKIYVDAFLIVRKNLNASMIVGDSTWDGGIFVSGNATVRSCVMKDIDFEVKGETDCAKHIKNISDPWEYFRQAS